MKPQIKTLNHTESWLFCAATLLKSKINQLSFYTKELTQYSDDFYAESLETLKNPQKFDRQLMKENQSLICFVSNWYFLYTYLTRLHQENPTEHGQIIWEALDYDYQNFPDELWKYNFKDSFRLYGIKFKLPSFVVQDDELKTKLIFFDVEIANIVKSYLDGFYKHLGIDDVVEQQENIVYIVKETTLGIRTYFFPQKINDYWTERIDRRLTIGASIIIFLFLVLAYLINLNSDWISSLLVLLTCFYIYRLVTDSMMNEFNRFNLVFQGLLILVTAFYYFLVAS